MCCNADAKSAALHNGRCQGTAYQNDVGDKSFAKMPRVTHAGSVVSPRQKNNDKLAMAKLATDAGAP